MASITLERVSKDYRDRRQPVPAVRDLSLHVADGELVVLVGPSGCGKTTTLRLIAGLEAPSEGTIRIGDRVVNHLAPRHRDVAMVFQNYALYPHLSVFDNIAFPLRMRGTPRSAIAAQVHQAAGLLGLDTLLHRKPRDLSGGERQRVALGRAMVRRPIVFLFDEPLSNLDAPLRVHMRGEIRALLRRLGTTAIYVTHDQEEAMTLGDRLVIMREGVVQQIGAPLEVYHHPANRFVGGLIGTPPMNFLPGRLDAGGASFTLRHGAVLPLPRALAQALADAGRSASGCDAVLGIRPERVSIAGEHGTGGTCSAGRLDATGGSPASVGATGGLPGAMPTPAGVGMSSPGATGGLPASAPSLAAPRPHSPPDACRSLLPTTMTVCAVEPLGDRTLVHLVSESGDVLVAREGPAVALAPAAAVQVVLDLQHAHLFAADAQGARL